MTDYTDLCRRLRSRLEWGSRLADESADAIETLMAERDAAMADARRFVWWVGPKAAVSLREYTDGVVKRWTVDQWREWTDKKMKGSGNDPR